MVPKKLSTRKLRANRERLERSRAEIAVAVHVSHAAYVLWEQGKHTPSLANALRLADVLGVPLDALLEDDVEAALQ